MALQRILNESSWIWFKLNFIKLVLSIFRDNLFTADHLFTIWYRCRSNLQVISD